MEEDIDSRNRQIEALDNQRISMMHDVKQATILAESEALAHRVAQELIEEAHRERLAKENEWRDNLTRLREEIAVRDVTLRHASAQYERHVQDLIQQKDDVERRLNLAASEIKKERSPSAAVNGYGDDGPVVVALKRQLEQEQVKKQQV